MILEVDPREPSKIALWFVVIEYYASFNVLFSETWKDAIYNTEGLTCRNQELEANQMRHPFQYYEYKKRGPSVKKTTWWKNCQTVPYLNW